MLGETLWWSTTHTHTQKTTHTPRLKGPVVGTLSTSEHCLPLRLTWGQIEQRDGLRETRSLF